MMERLTREERLALVAELCPRYGRRRACDSHALARERALAILELPDRAEVTADYVLVRAIDRYAAGTLDLRDLYRCRLLAYYMTFAAGGEEWARWGVAAAVNPGEFSTTPPELDPDDRPPLPPPGPPWGRT
jgi:hypothetical protein